MRLNRFLTFTVHYYTIMRRGVFMHSAYAAQYLNGRSRLIFSLAHYLWVGETRGHKPNPFYDPTFIGSISPCRLGDYLRAPVLWHEAPSRWLDPAWYTWHTPSAHASISPLEHLWRHGFDEDRSPAPQVDLRFFKDVVAFYRPDKKEFAFELLADPHRLVPGTMQVFEDAQRAFYAQIKLTIRRRPIAARRPYLVFVQASGTLINDYDDASRSYDLLVNDYGSDGEMASAPAADYVTAQRGTKTTAIRKLLEEAPEIVLGYRYVLFLDDDVRLSSADIDRLFATADVLNLDLAQASLTANSQCAFDILKQPAAGSGVIPLTAVEIMMPLISQRALRECGWVFGEAISGWAVDFLLGAEVRRRFGNRVALIGSVVAAHERPIDTQDGAFYRYLREHGIEATTEAGRIAHKFGIEVSAKAIRAHHAPLDR